MSRPGPRLHRLPQRLDYTLVPAPLDFPLSLATEKSPLPAIIVTPSSPSSSHDFSIAFCAPPPPPPLAKRTSPLTWFQSPVQLRARPTIIFLLISFILVCHVTTHRLTAQQSYLEFPVKGGETRTINNWTPWLNFRTVMGVDAENAREIPQIVDGTS